MTSKSDFSPEEWSQLLKAPLTAGMIVILADLHITSMARETKAILDAIQRQGADPAAEDLVSSLVGDLIRMAKNKETLPGTKQQPEGSQIQVISSMLEEVGIAAGILDARATPEETAGFKHWLMGVAEATAEAGREGGFLGIGSVRVSEKEKGALDQISNTLGL